MGPFQIFVACAPGLEALLADEVREVLGLEAKPIAGGVTLEGDTEVVYRANLELGLGTQVRVRITEFRATAFPQLVRRTAALDWARWLRMDVPLEIRASAKGSKLYHTGAIAERVRRAIGEALGRAPHEAQPEAPSARLHVRFERDRCTLSLDTSGAPLHRRGYRLATAKAPLREDLARALLWVSGWDRKSTLADPLMGSGTIPIEAALLARSVPPGRLRTFGFEHTALFEPARWKAVREAAESKAQSALPFRIFGSDRNAGALEAALANAERAGVAGDLDLAQAPLGKAQFLREATKPGTLVTNPPHGGRIGRGRDLRPLYQSLGHVVQSVLPSWRVALLVVDRRLALATGIPLETGVLTDSGGTKVRMMVGGAPSSAGR